MNEPKYQVKYIFAGAWGGINDLTYTEAEDEADRIYNHYHGFAEVWIEKTDEIQDRSSHN
jgi:hypothetical protein